MHKSLLERLKHNDKLIFLEKKEPHRKPPNGLIVLLNFLHLIPISNLQINVSL